MLMNPITVGLHRRIEQTLVDALYDVWDDEEFVTGVISQTRHPLDQETLLDFIMCGDDVTVETVALHSLELCTLRKGVKNETDDMGRIL